MQTLVFSWSQAYGPSSDPVSAGDVDAIDRAVAALAPLRKRYDVCLLINPSQAQDAKLWAALGRLAALGMGFFLAAYESDTLLIPARAKLANGDTSWHWAFDAAHGVAHSNHGVYNAVWTAFGPLLRGFWFGEVNTTTWSAKYRPDWWGSAITFAPYDGFRQQVHAEALVAWCKLHTDASGAPRRVLWGDPVWSGMGNAVPEILEGEQLLRNLAQAYPGVIVPVFANNVSPTAAPGYYPWLWPCMTAGTVGWGLSDQSYIIPGQEAVWAARALRDGALFVQFEPAWTWFNLPVGWAVDGAPYALANSGAGTPALTGLIAALMAA